MKSVLPFLFLLAAALTFGQRTEPSERDARALTRSVLNVDPNFGDV